ncbi:MAG: ATP-binding protein [Candidatus Eremiobacter antarcticus]|nr:P-loop NTPase [Candidatus Eremiobacteraeota bacterium]MBC5808094.1 P-loop NTPase [Candidatus Eremiobacteraeota bacterium]PZR63495.1 MAG: ATP-binding protein [Candidatus Eremiobacter sp. RRmetagenome_bin22]
MKAMISPDTTIKEVVERHPGAEKVFGAHGLPCAGCHVSARETIREGAGVHHLDLDALLRDLSRFINDGTVPPAQARAGAHAKAPPMEKQHKPGIDRVVAVMSGKGGVGKSLVTGLLAVALQRAGFRVGVLDADITGPSMARLFGVTARPYQGTDGKPHPPNSRSGIQIMSMNLILEDEAQAVIWRGPMVSTAIRQFYSDLEWGTLDYLLIDLPPGTSDAPLTVLQALPVSGVVLVSTPQGLATMIVSKAIKLVKQLGAPIIGLVENMSYFLDPQTGRRHELFGASKGVQLVVESGAPLLAQLAIDPALTQLCDAGRIEEYHSGDYETLVKNFVTVLPALSTAAAAR